MEHLSQAFQVVPQAGASVRLNPSLLQLRLTCHQAAPTGAPGGGFPGGGAPGGGFPGGGAPGGGFRAYYYFYSYNHWC